VTQTGRHLTRHTLYLRSMRARILRPGPLTLVLSPTTLGRGLERRGDRLRLNTLVTFKPAVGGIIRWHTPIVFGYENCTSGLTFHYTGAEQACVVPHYSEMRIIAVGGRGGNGWPDCGLSLNLGGAGGYGAQVDATRVSVHPGEVLYIEVGGDGGNGTHNCQIAGGAAGAGGWNGGARGGLGSGMVGSGGGGGATDVLTVSCATVCDQGLGFGTFISLASRIVVAGGGGGGGSGGGAGDCAPCRPPAAPVDRAAIRAGPTPTVARAARP
jgi:Glycine rich protein